MHIAFKTRPCLSMGIVLTTVALLLAATPLPASAHDMGHRIPDGQNIDINYQSLTADYQTSTDWNINNNFHPRDFGTINVVVNSVREINVLDANYSPLTWSGLWECVSQSGSICNQSNVHYNLRYAHDPAARRWLGCHEFGHAWGIDHNDNGCMPEHVYSAGTAYAAHNTAHIDSWY